MSIRTWKSFFCMANCWKCSLKWRWLPSAKIRIQLNWKFYFSKLLYLVHSPEKVWGISFFSRLNDDGWYLQMAILKAKICTNMVMAMMIKHDNMMVNPCIKVICPVYTYVLTLWQPMRESLYIRLSPPLIGPR